jgi:S-adenosylmethionine:diacylglycerol 3-amino-3-carboxypropyl transferase
MKYEGIVLVDFTIDADRSLSLRSKMKDMGAVCTVLSDHHQEWMISTDDTVEDVWTRLRPIVESSAVERTDVRRPREVITVE